MRAALECAPWVGHQCHRRGGGGAGDLDAPVQLVTGRWVGTAFGGWKSGPTRRRYLTGDRLEPYVTHTFDGVAATNDAFDALHGGDCLRRRVLGFSYGGFRGVAEVAVGGAVLSPYCKVESMCVRAGGAPACIV